MQTSRQIAVIGAGPIGLATLKELTTAGFDAVSFEASSTIGGTFSKYGFDFQLTSSSVHTGDLPFETRYGKLNPGQRPREPVENSDKFGFSPGPQGLTKIQICLNFPRANFRRGQIGNDFLANLICLCVLALFQLFIQANI